jgi:hypothetical protein
MHKILKACLNPGSYRQSACSVLLHILFAVFLFSPSLIFAGGSGQIVTETADGIDIWQQEFDVSGRKKGTYNYIVTARDAAGNEGISGPFNIKVDPMAGLPEARVIYPDNGQIIREDVSIVGVAAARYGVKQVLVKIDNGEYEDMGGNEYWSLFLNAMDLGEGKHTVYVRAVDNQDIMGPESKTSFILDIIPPEVQLINHQIGDLVSKTLKVRGRVHDYNGVKSLELSTDGENFSKLRLSRKRGDDGRYFQFSINTKKHEDGPLICYIRANNQTGTSVSRPYLFFVNNYPPQIEIISPKAGENLYGRTQVTGKIFTGVGLTEFYYEWAGERAEIPLRPGDPYWSVIVPISMANNRAIPFRITAIDKSGNVTTVSQRFQDLRRNRTPTLVIDYPPMPSGMSRMDLAPDQPIYGHILPGFFPYGIIIEGEIEYVMAQPSFRIDPSMIPEGRNTMRLWAIDEEDVTGQVFTLRVNKAVPPSDYEFSESPIEIDSPEEYDWFSDTVTFRGSIDSYTRDQVLEFRLNWNDTWRPINVSATGTFTAQISLIDLPEGAVPIEFRTIRDGRPDYPIYWPVNKYVTKPAIQFISPLEEYGAIHGEVTTTGVVDYFVPLRDISYSIDGFTYQRMNFIAKYGRAWFGESFDYTALHTNNQKLVIRAVDRAGNRVEASPAYEFDNSNDFPIVILNSPVEEEVVTGDFDISGLGYDDDGNVSIHWRLLSPWNPWDSIEETIRSNRHVEFNRIEIEQNFLFPITLFEVRDGENVLQIFAEDIYGVRSEVMQRVFKVSTMAPVTLVSEPAMDFWNRGNILVHGTTFDLNGIADIRVSMDNGISYQRTTFVSSQVESSSWYIHLNTQAYADGVYSMLIRTVDKYGVSSFSNGIVNIDNTPPVIDLGSPANGDKIGVSLPITGQVYDNIDFTRIAIQLVNVENPNLRRGYELPKQFVVMESMDVSAFPDGDYTLTVLAYDQADNETSIVRNFNILKARAASEIAIINPLPGITHHGPVTVSGKITGAVIPNYVTLMLDRQAYADIEVNRYGIFRQELPGDAILSEEPVVFSAYFLTPSGEEIMSLENKVKVINSYGPMLVIDSHDDGDVITKRPYISGRAYYVQGGIAEAAEEEVEPVETKRRGRRAADNAPPVATKVELSFDNGRSFTSAIGRDTWKYRLETGQLERGPLPVIIKANFSNGSIAIRRIMLIVDTRPPVVNTIGPPENSSHRSEVLVYGSSRDDFDMDTVEISLRPGDKVFYEVPGFIKGMYFDGSFLGGLNYTMGVGLTFFDDNVKVQFNASQAPPNTRYSGWAFGGKILANVYKKNLGEWFGPDWEFYTTSLVVGALFSYFMMEEGEDPLVMGQLLGQWEIIKADMSYIFPKWKYFKSISLYVEPGVWFAPSDVTGDEKAWRTKFTIGFGGRISLF